MIGTRLGDYQLLHALKSGGMGDVLLARRRGPGGFEQLCAIKTVRAELAETPLARAMFLDEARLLARLTHPAIAQILDFGEDDGTAYMVMEYVPGMSFRGLGELRPPAAVLCQAIAEACRGLHAAHELRDVADGHLLGVVHRDISPDNLMLGYDARVKVLDFGIALVRGRQAPVTELGTLKGKPPYMSPEQIKNLPIDRRSDVFSTAVVLWELLTGRALFVGDSIYAVARAVEEQPIVPPSTLVPGLPDGLDDLVLAGLARDPDRRLATAAAMAEVLERIAGAASRTSLEAWAEQALAPMREGHQRWLAGVVGDGRVSTGGMGRPSGVKTAVEGVAAPRGEDVVTVATRGREVAPATREVVGEAEPRAVSTPRSRRGVVIAAMLALLLGGAGVAWLATRGDGGATATDADAATETDADPETDADADPETDAATDAAVLDAPRSRERDASRGPVDAAPPAPVDAAARANVPVDAATATGRLAIGAWSPAAQVTVDGVDWRQTPVLPRVLPVGPHEVVLRSPLDRAIVYQATIVIEAGKTARIQPP